jgi:hypothetical protein
MDEAGHGFKESEDNHKFVDRYKTTWSYLHVIDTIFFMLERGKKYKLAALSLCCLLQDRAFECHHRGKWWHRLIMNLKHLKFQMQALNCCDLALIDEFVKDEKRNLVLKVRLTLFVDVHRLIKKSKKEADKAAKRKHKMMVKSGKQLRQSTFNKSKQKIACKFFHSYKKFNRDHQCSKKQSHERT